MALRECMECGHDVSDKAAACPRCGCPVSEVGFPGVTPLSDFKMHGTRIEEYLGSSKRVVIPDSVTEIGWSAFCGRTSLREVSIPDSVTIIVEGAFEGCTSLEGFSVSPGNPAYCAIDGVLFSGDGRKLIAYPNAKGPHTPSPVPSRRSANAPSPTAPRSRRSPSPIPSPRSSGAPFTAAPRSRRLASRIPSPR